MDSLFLDISYKWNHILCGLSCLAPFMAHRAFEVHPSCVVFVVQLLGCVQFFAAPWTAACQASLSFIISWSLLRFMSTESVTPSSHLILCHSLSFGFFLLVFIAQYHSVAWLFHISPTHSPTDGNLGCFKYLAIMRNAPMNIYAHLCVCVCVDMFSLLLDKVLRVEQNC